MKISINNGDSAVHTGFGHATLKLISNIAKTEHSVLINRSSNFEMTFGHPNHYKFINPNSYKIGYTAWESTEIQPSWTEQLSQIDELWVPNNFCKDVFSNHFDKPIIVFPHGVDSTFATKKREYDGTLKFLHIGFPALRKNANDVIEAFLDLYKGREDVTLTIKAYENCAVPGLDEPNINIIAKTTSYAELVEIMHNHDVLLYPSWGEGFGLIPLQALATGMPVVVTDGWCDYDYFAPDLVVKSELRYSPWQNIHPGKMFKPDYEDLKEKMLYAEKNIEMLLKRHFHSAKDVHEEWSWERLVKEHFDAVHARLVV